MKSIPIFIINLKKDKLKKEHMQELCQKYDLQVNFIEAVYGKELSREENNASYSKEKSIREIGREMSEGEIGCALSHKMVYQKMISNNIQDAIVFEDDVEFDENLLKVIKQRYKFPKKAELVLLGYWREDIPNIKKLISFRERYLLIDNYQTVRFTGLVHGTYGYYLTNQGAKKLLNHLSKSIYMPIDHYTGDDRFVNMYGIYPPVVYLSSKFDFLTELEKERLEKRSTIKPIEKYNRIKSFLKMIGVLNIVKSFIAKYRDLKQYLKRFKQPRQYK